MLLLSLTACKKAKNADIIGLSPNVTVSIIDFVPCTLIIMTI